MADNDSSTVTNGKNGVRRDLYWRIITIVFSIISGLYIIFGMINKIDTQLNINSSNIEDMRIKLTNIQRNVDAHQIEISTLRSTLLEKKTHYYDMGIIKTALDKNIELIMNNLRTVSVIQGQLDTFITDHQEK